MGGVGTEGKAWCGTPRDTLPAGAKVSKCLFAPDVRAVGNQWPQLLEGAAGHLVCGLGRGFSFTESHGEQARPSHAFSDSSLAVFKDKPRNREAS